MEPRGDRLLRCHALPARQGRSCLAHTAIDDEVFFGGGRDWEKDFVREKDILQQENTYLCKLHYEYIIM